MSIVEHYHLGEIVGVPTAGTNGNIALTIPASRTIAGVIAGRDEVLKIALEIALEIALRYVRTGAK